MSVTMPALTMDDLAVWARTVWAEARGEGELGMLAVAHVINNRAVDPGRDWWGDSIAEVCLKPWQFSCWNELDPNRGKLLRVGLEDPQYRIALRCCLAVLTGAADPTVGADHYHTLSIAPVWARGRARIATIGRHAFYRLGAG